MIAKAFIVVISFAYAFAACTNIAVNKHVSQSSYASTPNNGGPATVTDGDTNTDFAAGTCTSTELEEHPYVQIDLGAQEDIQDVFILNRDDPNSDRMTNVEVTVDPDSGDPILCGVFPGTVGPGEALTISCAAGTNGRYVRVQLKDAPKQQLQTCEVQVIQCV